MFYPEPQRSEKTNYNRYSSSTGEEIKYPDPIAATDFDPKSLRFVRNKVKKYYPKDTSFEQICSIAKTHLSPIDLGHYFTHLVSGTASDVILETADESGSSFSNTWEKTMQQKRTLKRFEAVVNLPVKLILMDLQNALPPFASSFARMLQLEFGALHAALIIGDVIVEWDDTSLILPIMEEKQWVFQARLESKYDKFAQNMKPEMRDSAHKMDIQKQIEQIFEVTKEKQEAINQLVDLIVHYNEHYEYNVLTRNCQHFVIDAMKALGIEEVPQFTGVFKDYFEELKQGKSIDILDKFEDHAALDQHVNSILKPGLSQHDLEYILCQYFMFHVSCQKNSSRAQDPDWCCEEETCRMSDIEYMIEHDASLLLFTSFRSRSNNISS